jgi:hypothetical protein
VVSLHKSDFRLREEGEIPDLQTRFCLSGVKGNTASHSGEDGDGKSAHDGGVEENF